MEERINTQELEVAPGFSGSEGAGMGCIPDGIRQMYEHLARQVETEQNIETIRSAAERTASVAHDAKLSRLEIAAHLLLGAHAAKREAYGVALKAYRAAETASESALDLEVEERLIQRRAARMAVGTALLGLGDFPAAAATFRALGEEPVGEGQLDMRVEYWWLAAYSYARARQYEQGWAFGRKALDLAEPSPATPRRRTSMANAGAVLLAIADKSSAHAAQRAVVENRITKALGKDWQADVKSVRQSAAS